MPMIMDSDRISLPHGSVWPKSFILCIRCEERSFEHMITQPTRPEQNKLCRASEILEPDIMHME